VKVQNYPALFITAGLNDDSVFFWEPAKWTAKLRKMKTDQNLLLLKTEMDAGHGGASGRLQELRDKARDFVFLLHLEGVKN
jgi:oligopeptidase B